MTGSLLQLAAKGADDIYLTKTPQITLFKIVYRRHTNFSIYDLIKVPKAQNTFGIDFQSELDKAGDLLHKVYLTVELPDLNLKNIQPTCKNIKKLLLEYGIIWNTNVIMDYNIIDTCPNIITLQFYNQTLIQIINEQIRRNIDMYNFYSNGKILSASPNYLLRRQIKDKLANGTVASLTLLANMLTKYSQEYSPVYTSEYWPNLLSNRYLVANDSYGVKKHPIMMFSELFRAAYTNGDPNVVFNAGIMLQMLLNYYYDTAIFNVNGPNSLFGELLNRLPTLPNNAPVDFKLYNASDIQNIFYQAFLYNLTRRQIVNMDPPFSLDHITVNITDISPPLNNPTLLGSYNPYVSKISDNIIFYHVLDPAATTYTITDAMINTPIQDYFDHFIQTKYATFNQYPDIFPFYTPVNYTQLDAYKIYKKYITQNNTAITTISQVISIATAILAHIKYNMQYNLALIRNTMTALHNADYRFSYFKRYRANQTPTTPFVGTTTFLNNSDTTINLLPSDIQTNLNDQFERTIRANEIINNEYFLSINASTGTELLPNTTTNYFSNEINSAIANLRTQNNAIIATIEQLGYTNDFRLWQQGTKIAIMNNIPFLAATDIPNMIYDLYSTIPKIQSVLGDLFNNFLAEIDFRTNPITTQIRNRLITDDVHYSQIVDTYSQGGFLLALSFKPEPPFPQYSIIDQNNNLIDQGALSFLPIEWITQTYYTTLASKITAFFAAHPNLSTEANNFLLLLKSITNSFITTNLPPYANYRNNGYLLLGLLPETSLPPADYLIKTSAPVPLYSDATSSIWYQLQTQFIAQYNAMFTSTLLSPTYYANHLGTTAQDVLTHFQHTVNGELALTHFNNDQQVTDANIQQIGTINDLTNSKSISILINTATFTSAVDPLEERVLIDFGNQIAVLRNPTTANYDETYDIPPNTQTATISYINHPGFQIYLNVLVFLNDTPSPDFFRLTLSLINRFTNKTKYTEITDFINDNITLFNTGLTYYTDRAPILQFNTDTVWNAIPISDLYYDESEQIISQLATHITTKYIDSLPLTANSNDITTNSSSPHPLITNAPATPSDIIGYAFSVIDNTANEIGIGLSSSPPSTSSFLQMFRSGPNQYLQTPIGQIPYDQLPTLSPTDIYYAFYNNSTNEFTVYENKNITPLVTASLPSSLFTNLLLFGPTQIRFYSARFAYAETSGTVQALINSTTKWFYIGAQNIAPYASGALSTVTYSLHTEYIDGPQIKQTNIAPSLLATLQSIAQSLNPNANHNIYNLNGIHGTPKNSRNIPTPINLNTAIYSPLDSIYNNHLTGNLNTTFQSANIPPPFTKIQTNFISNSDNPFYSPALRDNFSSISISTPNLLTYNDTKQIANLFDNSIHANGPTTYALNNLIYLKSNTFANTQLFPISPTATIGTSDPNTHIFSTTSYASLQTITGIPVTNQQIYGVSFTITNIQDGPTPIEIGFLLNNQNKIVLQKTSQYALQLTYIDATSTYQQSFPFLRNPNFNLPNVYTFFVFNTAAPIHQYTLQVYENFSLIFNQTIDPLSPYINLFQTQNINLFIQGQIGITFHSKQTTLARSTTAIRQIINSNTVWLSTNDPNPFVAMTAQKIGIPDRMENDKTSVTLSGIGTDGNYLFAPIKVTPLDIIGFAFEVTTVPNQIAIGLTNLQIQKNGQNYALLVKNTSIPLPPITFAPNAIILCIQNNQTSTFSIFQNNEPIFTLTAFQSPEFEQLTTQQSTNLQITTTSPAKINFYTAKYIFNHSSIQNQILLTSLTKWLYIGALDTTPVSQIVLSSTTTTTHKFTNAQSNLSTVTIDNPDHADVTPNSPIIAQSLGGGIQKLFDPESPSDTAAFIEYVGLTPGPTTLTNTFAMAFSITPGSSNFSVGFISTPNSYIAFSKTANIYSLTIKSLSFTPTSNEYQTLQIPLPSLKITPKSIFYALQNNETNTFTLYQDNNLIAQITTATPEYSNLLFQITPPLYGTLKTIANIGVSGDATIRFYSNRHIQKNAPNNILWFGLTTIENPKIHNTSDSHIIGINNTQVQLDPPFQIPAGLSFTIADGNTFTIGITNIAEIRSTPTTKSITIDNTEYPVPTASFSPTDIYHLFISPTDLTLYENAIKIFSAPISSPHPPSASITLSGQMNLIMHNAPYAYLKTTPEIKILINNTPTWLSLGGSNTGPIRQRLLTSKNMYTDLIIDRLFTDGPLPNFSFMTLYTYTQILKYLQSILPIDLTPFVDLIEPITPFVDCTLPCIPPPHIRPRSPPCHRPKCPPIRCLPLAQIILSHPQPMSDYAKTLANLSSYFQQQITSFFNAILKITSLSTANCKLQLTINDFNIFLDNSYKIPALDYYTSDATHIVVDDYYQTGFADYQFDNNITVNFYMPTLTGRSNGIIDPQSDLESRLLKLITNAPPKFAWVKELGHKIIKEVTVLIGDQCIETHNSNLFHLMHELRITSEQKRGYDKMIGNTAEMYTYSSDTRTIRKLYIPMYFWFCEHHGNALPLISLLHSKVELDFKIEGLNELVYIEKDSFISGTPKVKYELLCQYVYLDADERSRMSNSKLEYLIEKYNYNGKDTISRTINFPHDVRGPTEFIDPRTQPAECCPGFGPITAQGTLGPIYFALENLVYHTHLGISGDGIIEMRPGQINYREVITHGTGDYLFNGAFSFSESKVIGFAFKMISYPEVNPATGMYDSGLTGPAFGIGLTYWGTTAPIGRVYLTTDGVVVVNLVTGEIAVVPYIVEPGFRGGALAEVNDIYVCIQDNGAKKFLVYENSVLIADVQGGGEGGVYAGIVMFAQVGLQMVPTERLSLYVKGPIRADYYNAKVPYNDGNRVLRNEMDGLTDWLYVGGDNTPLTEIFNRQEVRVENVPAGVEGNVMDYGVEMRVPADGEYVAQPALGVSGNSLIGFAFSLDYEMPQLSYDLAIGLACEMGSIQMREIGGVWDIYISDGVNTSSVPFIVNPAAAGRDIVYTMIQDNVSKTFTIFEENRIIGQVDRSNRVYANLLGLLGESVQIRFDVGRLVAGPLLINFYTSNAVLERHARLNLRRVVTNVTDWISFVSFVPSFYGSSFSDVQTNVIDTVSSKGKIVRGVIGESNDVIMRGKCWDYLLRPNAGIGQMEAFSFSVLGCEQLGDFSIGMTQFSNTSNSIMFRRLDGRYYLEVKTVKKVSALQQFTKKYVCGGKVSKTFCRACDCKECCCTIGPRNAESVDRIGIDVIVGEDSVYTMVQDNALGVFTLFMDGHIIGQVTLRNAEYRRLFEGEKGLRHGINIMMNGLERVRFYTAEYIYGLGGNVHFYLERVDRWYFVDKVTDEVTTIVAPYRPTPVPIKVRLDDPIKYLIWYMKAYDDTTREPIDMVNWAKYGFNVRDVEGNYVSVYPIVENMKLEMFGLDREKAREEVYFTRTVPWARGMQSLRKGEYVYSFALFPMAIQPSGACNYSEINDSKLIINFTNEVETMMRNNKNIRIELELWGRSYNILRVVSGMGGLLFYSSHKRE